MTVVVILSVFLLSFFQCYLGETTNICQPDFACVPYAECDIQLNEGEFLYPCKQGKQICCPKLKNSIASTTQGYEPFNTIKTTRYQPYLSTDPDENRIQKTTSYYNIENTDYNLDRGQDLTSHSSHIKGGVFTVNHNGERDVLANNRNQDKFNHKSSNNKVNVSGYPEISNNCRQNFFCVPIAECDFKFDTGEVSYPCKHRKNVCCPRLKNQSNNDRTTQKYEPFNTITPFLYHQNNLHEDEGRVEKVNRTKETISESDNHAINRTIHNFNSYSSNNPKYQNDSFKIPGENILSNNDGKYVTTSSYADMSLISNISTNNNHNSNGISQQNFNRNKNTRPATAHGSDEIIFNIYDENNISNTNHAGSVNYVNKNVVDRTKTTKKDIFSKNCGITIAHDKITGGKIAELGQFPWMALLGFKHSRGRSLQFLCGGSLITKRDVLTAAHCIVENHQLELHSIRFGEYNLTTDKDCVQFGKDEVCADHHVDIAIDRVTIHPEFNRTSLKNDIAIIRIRKEVEISDYINTICLPFGKDYSNFNMTGQNFTVSGWGKSNSGDLFGTNELQFAKVTTWDPIKCNNSLPSEVKPLSITQLCANGANSEDSCKGDSGGPLINVTLDKDLEVRNIQFGVVSFGTGTCGDKNLPTIYTRVDKYLQWILKNVS